MAKCKDFNFHNADLSWDKSMIGNATDRMDDGIDNGNICDNCASPTQPPVPIN